VQEGGCIGCDVLLELNVCRQNGGCNGYDGLMELTVWRQDGGVKGCDGLLELCEGRTMDVMVLIVQWNKWWKLLDRYSN
jgi:hypothetical protein